MGDEAVSIRFLRALVRGAREGMVEGEEDSSSSPPPLKERKPCNSNVSAWPTTTSWLKGHNRTAFEKKLMYNLQALLDRPCVEKVIRISGRILVIFVHDATEEDAESTVSLIARVPGVVRVSCGFSCERDIDIMCEAAAQALAEAGEFTTWKVVARRSHTDFEIDSMQMNQIVGAHLCERFPDKPVKMKHPDVEVHVEVVQGHAYIYALSVPGGRFAVGTAGKQPFLGHRLAQAGVAHGAPRRHRHRSAFLRAPADGFDLGISG